jgi:hypothetical protein
MNSGAMDVSQVKDGRLEAQDAQEMVNSQSLDGSIWQPWRARLRSAVALEHASLLTSHGYFASAVHKKYRWGGSSALRRILKFELGFLLHLTAMPSYVLVSVVHAAAQPNATQLR